ncbi:unnamed protein product, partial [Symbiodinium pilosum]
MGSTKRKSDTKSEKGSGGGKVGKRQTTLPVGDGKKAGDLSPDIKIMTIFRQWSKQMEEFRTVNNFFAQGAFKTKEKLLKFLKHLESTYPPQGKTSDPQAMVFVTSFGTSDLAANNDSHLMLCELIVANGFVTDANIAGTEKLAVTAPRPDIGLSPDFVLDAADIDAACDGLLHPQQLVYVKGWSRAIAALTVMLCRYENPEFAEAWGDSHRDSFATIHATVNVVGLDDAALMVLNNSITLGSSVRRKPNCFNLVHQLALAKRMQR